MSEKSVNTHPSSAWKFNTHPTFISLADRLAEEGKISDLTISLRKWDKITNWGCSMPFAVGAAGALVLGWWSIPITVGALALGGKLSFKYTDLKEEIKTIDQRLVTDDRLKQSWKSFQYEVGMRVRNNCPNAIAKKSEKKSNDPSNYNGENEGLVASALTTLSSSKATARKKWAAAYSLGRFAANGKISPEIIGKSICRPGNSTSQSVQSLSV